MIGNGCSCNKNSNGDDDRVKCDLSVKNDKQEPITFFVGDHEKLLQPGHAWTFPALSPQVDEHGKLFVRMKKYFHTTKKAQSTRIYVKDGQETGRVEEL